MKYIIDIPDADVSRWVGITPLGKKLYIPISVEDGKEYSIATEIYAEDYIEPNRKDIEDEVWNFVAKIECMTCGEVHEVFGIDEDSSVWLCNQMSYQEAKAKYESWLKQRDEIRVGDEVKENSRLWTGVVVGFDEFSDLIIMDRSGKSCDGYKTRFFRKTGRHFDEVEELLKKMGEE